MPSVAKKTLIIDDLTGDTGARTRVLTFEGVEYEIDLTDASFADLRRLLKPYLKAARPVRAPRSGAPSPLTSPATGVPAVQVGAADAMEAGPAATAAVVRTRDSAAPSTVRRQGVRVMSPR